MLTFSATCTLAALAPENSLGNTWVISAIYLGQTDGGWLIVSMLTLSATCIMAALAPENS
jgi:hypothetical protein